MTKTESPAALGLTLQEKFGATGRLQSFGVLIRHRKKFGVYSNWSITPGNNLNDEYFNGSPWSPLCDDSQKPPELLLLLFWLLSIIDTLGLFCLYFWRQESCQSSDNNFKPLEGIVYKRTPTEHGLLCSQSDFLQIISKLKLIIILANDAFKAEAP